MPKTTDLTQWLFLKNDRLLIVSGIFGWFILFSLYWLLMNFWGMGIPNISFTFWRINILWSGQPIIETILGYSGVGIILVIMLREFKRYFKSY